MRRKEAIELLKLQISSAEFVAMYTHNDRDVEKELKNAEAFRMAIEALSKPNYESDNEVRLAVTNRKKEKVILWDAFGEVEYYPNGEINCVHCPRYYETEDDIGVHSHCRSHGRLIDADALMEYCSNQKTKTINNNDIARFPIADVVSREEYNKMKKIAKSWQDEFRNASEIANKLFVDRPQGEWICKGDYAVCSECGGSSGTQFDGVEPIPLKTKFCHNCGARMKGSENE